MATDQSWPHFVHRNRRMHTLPYGFDMPFRLTFSERHLGFGQHGLLEHRIGVLAKHSLMPNASPELPHFSCCSASNMTKSSNHKTETGAQNPGSQVGMLIPLAFTLESAAQATGLSSRTLRRLVKRGLLKPSRATRRFIFSRVEIERFLAETTAE